MLHSVELGQGKIVLILHGATLDHRHMMEALEPVFSTLNGWRRVYIDLPGHGSSPADPEINTQEDVLQRIISWAVEKFPGQRFILTGESRGSYLSQGFATLRPDLVDGMLLVVPGGSPTADPSRLPVPSQIVSNPEFRAKLDPELQSRFDRLVVQTPEIFDKMLRTKFAAIPLHDAALAKRVWASFDFPFKLHSAERTFDKPCLIVAGRQDAMSGYLDAMDCMDGYPRATLAVLDSAGHSLAFERPDLFHALVRDWLERIEVDADQRSPNT